MKLIILFLTIVSAGLLAGGLFVIWIEYGSYSLSAQGYVEQQQNVIKADLNVIMPLIGRISVVLTLISAFLHRKNRAILVFLIIAVALTLVAGAVTRWGNQPVNGIVVNWKLENIPSDWIDLREKWNSLHFIRTIASVIAFCLIVYTALYKLEATVAEPNV